MTSTTAPFHPIIQAWFKTVFGEATEIQRRAWPEIAAGRHVLLTAPTGGGKTLASFLLAIDRLISGVWCGGTTRVLYISPLKALNNDIRYNLTLPLTGIAAEFAAAGLSKRTLW